MVQKLTRFLLPGMLVIGQLIGMETAHGAAGSLDPAFGTGGVAITNLGIGGVNSIRLQSTGEILVLVLAISSNESCDLTPRASWTRLSAITGLRSRSAAVCRSPRTARS